MDKYFKDLPHYLTLMGIFVAGFLGFYLFKFDRNFQFIVGVAVSVSYVVWGILHHHLHKDLYWEVVFEYVAFSVFGFGILYLLILNS